MTSPNAAAYWYVLGGTLTAFTVLVIVLAVLMRRDR